VPDNELQDLSARLGELANRLPTTIVKDMGEVIGKGAVKDAQEAVRADGVGDLVMSGWKVQIEADYKVTKGSVVITPAKVSRGPFRVMEQGRNMGDTGLVQGPGVVRKGARAGETLRTKKGALRKVRTTTAKRWNGYTRAKFTWSDALKLMTKNTTGRAMEVLADNARQDVIGR